MVLSVLGLELVYILYRVSRVYFFRKLEFNFIRVGGFIVMIGGRRGVGEFLLSVYCV